ncbi:thiosulfate sulfurtransferase GlpE [Candidatus Regiella insecticola]|uniref:Thiosulfate sulfurtransferase GlpE n=1 Tax=Candidatus Regiella insecticola TaxID=138073 RepID=A0A6L2ZLF9_9ENTR|nr:thiosulfate sulfurtransferase GlpE [Candidatus Regiella insecticola]GFN45190.1 thiosulfate sulfurtransferase GlpE [Candidatus Regiella insecticola]
MKKFKIISVEQAYSYWIKNDGLLVDIRDSQSYISNHIPGAIHLTNDNLSHFIQQTDFAKLLMVMCYHGNSSKRVAQYLLEQGFTEICSIEGGFDAWSKRYLNLSSG